MISSFEMKQRVASAYNLDPQGWQAYTSRDQEGHIETVFLHGDDLYVLKEEMINPFKSVGVAVQEKINSNRAPTTSPSFGLRPVTDDILQRMTTFKEPSDLIGAVMRQKPIPTARIRAPAVVQGPVNFSPSPLRIMGEQQDNLDAKLRRELNKLVDREYPHLRSIYR
ncbi:MAG: hypothetical protein V3T23_10655 [Nitrososphaerales archaeon]|jgi:hypothetical protein